MTLHRVGRSGHMLHADRVGRVITVRGEPRQVSPLRVTVPGEVALDRLAGELVRDGETLQPLTVSRTSEHSPVICTYLAKGSSMSKESTPGIEYAFTIVRDARGNVPRGTLRSGQTYESFDAARLSAVSQAAAYNGLELICPGHVYGERERRGELERFALRGWRKYMLNAGTPGLIGEVYIHPASVSPESLEQIIATDSST